MHRCFFYLLRDIYLFCHAESLRISSHIISNFPDAAAAAAATAADSTALIGSNSKFATSNLVSRFRWCVYQ